MEPLLTTEEVAEYLKVDVVTVRRLVNRGELSAYRVGGEYRFTKADIDQYLQQQRVSGAGMEEQPARAPGDPAQWVRKMLQGKRVSPVEFVASDRFDKFTGRARKVLSLAQEEARSFQHNYIGTEHLLLGLIREKEGVAAKVLTNLGVELDKVRSSIEHIIGRGDRIVVGPVGLTPRSKKVIELSMDEARRMNHHYIGTEHLLLGLVREGEGVAAGVLASLGVRLEQVRIATTQVLSQVQGQGQERENDQEQEPNLGVIPPVPPEASSLLKEGEQGQICSYCGAANPAYFHYCFNCGKQLA